MAPYYLEMKGIVKRFPGTVALDHVDLFLKKGEIMALIGENGAGKSTLMNVLMGNLIADEGTILLNGEEIKNRNPREALQRGIGMVPQELNLARGLTVAENVFLGKYPKKHGVVDWDRMAEEAEKIISTLDVTIDPREIAGNLSAAYQQMVVIARTLHAGSELIIFDEPTASLTIKETKHLLQIIRRLADEGKCIVLITHHLDEVKAISDSVTVLRDGSLVKAEDTDKLSIEEMIFYMANQNVQRQVYIEREYSDETILEVEGLSRKGEFKDVSFAVKRGEIFGIAGLIGSGRTELINCIYGLTKRESGTVRFEGSELAAKTPIDAIKCGIGLVPEERRRDGIFPLMSVQENIMLPSIDTVSSGGVVNYSKLKSRAESAIERLRVKTASPENAIKNLSGGNQQKAILARWVEKKLKLLFLDEPTRGIDVRAKSEIYDLIRSLADSGLTVVVVSSELDEILAIADRIMVMFEGEVKGIVSGKENLTSEELLKIALK